MRREVRLSEERRYETDRGVLDLSWDWGSIPRPRLWGWLDGPNAGLVVDVSNGVSDAVVSVSWSFAVSWDPEAVDPDRTTWRRRALRWLADR